MKLSELTIISENLNLTPSTWGDVSCVIIDEDEAVESMSECMEVDIDDLHVDLNLDGNKRVSIAKDDIGNFYAIEGSKYCECENPENIKDGLAEIYGELCEFDEEE